MLIALTALLPLIPIVTGIAVIALGRRVSDLVATRIVVGGLGACLGLLLLVRALATLDTQTPVPISGSVTWFAIPLGAETGDGSLPAFVAEIGVQVDDLTCVLLPAMLVAAALLLSEGRHVFDGSRSLRRFLATAAAAVGVANAVVLSPNLFQAAGCWTLAAVAGYLVAAVNADRTTTAAAARKILIVHLATDALLVMAVLLCWYRIGSLRFDELPIALFGFLHSTAEAGDPAFGRAIAGSIGFGAFAAVIGRCALFPLFGWLHDAARLPMPVTGLLQVVLALPCGVLLLARLVMVCELGGMGEAVAMVGGVTALLAGLVAIPQMDPRQVLVFAAASVTGVIVAGLGLGTPQSAAGAVLLTASALPLSAVCWVGLRYVVERSVDGDVMLDHAQPIVLPDAIRWPVLAACVLLTTGLFGQNAIVESMFATSDSQYANPADVPMLDDGVTNVLPVEEANALSSRHVLTWLLLAGMSASAYAVCRGAVLLLRREQTGETVRVVESETNQPGSIPLLTVGVTLVVGAAVGLFWPEALAGSFVTTKGDTPGNVFGLGLATGAGAIGLVAAWTLHRRPSAMPARIAEGLGPFTRLSRHRFYLDDFFFLFAALPIRGLAQLCRFVDWFVVDGLVSGLPRRLLKLWDVAAAPVRDDASRRLPVLAIVLASVVLAVTIAWL